MSSNGNGREKTGVLPLTVAAIGVVFGDIGTSPLYAMREAFNGSHPVAANHDNVLGVLSLISWALIIVVTLKYVVFMMRADNRGEGGIMALLALVLRSTTRNTRGRMILMSLGLFGAALFYGDGVITPAISVLSAVEGLEVATPALKPFVIPATVLVLIGLFLFQQKGTEMVGALFGPVTIVWFAVLALLGIVNIVNYPQVLAAFSPGYGVAFFAENSTGGFLVLGAVVLAITGTEALYADMGHFGKKPIRLAWSCYVLPALLLNYFGQGALILYNNDAIPNPFYHMAPEWALYPLVILATMATVIASQAVISGTYSLTRQAIQLGYCPRLEVTHTSESEIGQVYMPWINWVLLAAVIGLVLGFESSSHLAGAYGIAVTGTMAIDTVLAFVLMRRLWHWPLWIAVPLLLIFLTIDLSFFSANAIKLLQGGWFPIVVAIALFTLLVTWKRGRLLLMERLSPGAIPIEPFIQSVTAHPPTRVPGTSVFLTAASEGVPHALLHNLNHNKVLHERIVLLTVSTIDIPHVPDEERIEVQSLGSDFYRLIVRYGFKDEPDVPRALELASAKGFKFEMMETSFFLSRQTLIPKVGPGMALWREKLFALMSRNASSATTFFKIPANRVVELGTRIEL
ncbi:MAG: potassium transporter Kup [Betaproteobacteria bacterium]|nr:potassium transporter Kup [Betaproteobacteria bacterium]